jgi:hypothetical protein
VGQLQDVHPKLAAGFKLNPHTIQKVYQYLRSTPAVKMTSVAGKVIPQYLENLHDVMHAWSDEPDFTDKCSFWLLLLAFLDQCDKGKKGRAWQAWAQPLIATYVRESPFNKDLFTWAYDTMNARRLELGLRLTSESVERLMGDDPSSENPHALEYVLNRIGSETDEAIRRTAGSEEISDAEKVLAILKAKPIEEGTFFWWCYKRNIPCPLGFIAFRPMMRYTMGTAVLMVAGKATGKSFISHADFQLGDDVTRKMHVGNFTFYAKPAILVPKNIAFAENIYCTEYNGGNGTRFWPYEDFAKQNLRDGNVEGYDLFCVAVPLEFDVKRRFIDMVGHYNKNLCNDVNDDTPSQYPSAREYADYWGWSHPPPTDPTDLTTRITDSVPYHNTVCVQDHQRMFLYTGKGGGEFKQYITNKGHWCVCVCVCVCVLIWFVYLF